MGQPSVRRIVMLGFHVPVDDMTAHSRDVSIDEQQVGPIATASHFTCYCSATRLRTRSPRYSRPPGDDRPLPLSHHPHRRLPPTPPCLFITPPPPPPSTLLLPPAFFRRFQHSEQCPSGADP